MKYWMIGLALFALVACSGNETHQADKAKPESEEPPTAVVENNPEPAEETKVAGDWMTAYLGVQEALADDNFETASAAAKTLSENAEEAMKAMALKVAEAADIESLRAAFKDVSESIKDQDLPEGHVLAYCPMAFDDAGAHWVQKQGDIMNPYFGASMLHCGVIRTAAADE